jgi:hypothetical protein
MTMNHLSTSTPASEISSADFDRNDGGSGEELNVPSLDDIMRNSPAAELLGLNKESLPDEEDDVPTPEESEDVPPSTEDDDNELDEDKTEEETDDKQEDEDDSSTQDTDLPAEEDIDWEYKVPVTINGKTEYKTLEEIRKGYSTDQHLSQKGRELGEQKKQVEQERTEKLAEIVRIGSVLNAELTQVESGLQKEYHELSAKIDKAREDGDTYTVRELKEQRESVQEKYWNSRNKREEQAKVITEQWQKEQQAAQQTLLKQFDTDVKALIPDYTPKVATAAREFAIKEGIPEAMLDVIYDARVVKFINDYRKLKTAKETGEVRRKAAPSVKSVPTKKGTPQSQRQKDADTSSRQKVLSGQGSQQDQLDFLKRISSVSKKL